MKIKAGIVVVIIFIAGIIVNNHTKISDSKAVLTAGIQAGWGPLNPPQQSSYMAAQILSNVFESLVAYDLEGNLGPQLARSWEVSDDLRTYTFILDTKRRFSDGSYMSAAVVKQAWEHALTINPASSNQSALDLLYLVDGFEKFGETKTLTGIEASHEDTLVIRFQKPFRQALSFLAGARYGVYLRDADGNYLGTGSYRFAESKENEVLLETNPYAREQPAFLQVKILGIDRNDIENAICEQRMDVIWIPYSIETKKCSSDRLSHLFASGAYATHLVLAVNGSADRLFSDSRLRAALQYLVLSHAKEIVGIFYDLDQVLVSPQFLLPLQFGHLPDDDVASRVNEGKEWVSELVELTREKPLRFWILNERYQIVADVLRNSGLTLKINDTSMSADDYWKLFYKTYEYDILLMSLGFGSIDPDGLYHSLGKNGAISTPPMGRKPVWEILEKGRSLISPDEMRTVYSELSRTILREVPAVHLASSRPMYFFNKERVRIAGRAINSPQFHFNAFYPVF